MVLITFTYLSILKITHNDKHIIDHFVRDYKLEIYNAISPD